MEPFQRTALIQAVLNAVDGCYDNSDNAVRNLVRSGVKLTSDEVNAIMASFLMERSDYRCIKAYGEGHGHEFLKQFGAKVPRCSYNQLHSNGLGSYFHKNFIEGNGLVLNQTLYGLFCGLFHLGGVWTTTEAAVAYIMNKQNEYFCKLKEEIRNQRLVVMTGTGVSLGIVNDNKLSWEGLLNAIRTILNSRRYNIIPDDEWLGRPEDKARKLNDIVNTNFAHLDYRQFVSVIMREIIPPDCSPLALAISNLKLPIATTNYDLILDQCLHRFEQNLSNIAIRFSTQHHPEFVYHVHGVWFDSNSVVLSNDDYERTQYEFEYAIGKLFFDSAGAKQHRSLLFVGSKYGMVDAHFSTLYTDPRFAHLCHFALLKTEDVTHLLDIPEFYNAFCNNRLIPVIYGDRYDLLPYFLQELARP
mmetsp:Transcript_21772/g.31692  ORF Transcript_21772/g.31692 Transcript_21772/m.31692 type:complete len:415 (-) Transcript_21772:63-1307(-)